MDFYRLVETIPINKNLNHYVCYQCGCNIWKSSIRYLTAARFIKKGELILKEKPLLVDSHRSSRNFCLKCCSYIKTDTYVICNRCNVAMLCRRNCEGEFHSESECMELKKLNLKPRFLTEHQEIITVLRLFLKKKYSEDEWNKINQLESHLEERRNTPIWKSCDSLIVQVMKDANIISQEDEISEIVQKLCGILDVNTFELRPPYDQSDIVVQLEHQALRGLYPKAALMAHNCVSNTHLAVDNDFVLYIHASVDIEEGSPIFFNYANVLDDNIERNKFLKQGKYFECTCERCMDPTELNTNLSALKCHNCKKGLIHPHRTIENRINWSCISCKKNFHNSMMRTTLGLAKDLVFRTGPSNLTKLEEVNRTLLQTLYPHHHLILELQQILMGCYTQDIPSKKNLLGKIKSCENVLAVTQILDPGISRIQGITLYELHAAKANLAYKEYSEKEINTKILLKRLLSAEETLRAALEHLMYEPKNSPEGYLAKNAFGYLKKLRESISNIKEQSLLENIVKTSSSGKKRNRKH